MIHSKSTMPLSGIAEINPNVNLKGLKDTEEVSFVPMADVTDSGRWINRQTRPLKDVRVGYTGFQEGDVLFAKITPCMENGKGAHAIGLVNGFGFGSTELHVLRAKGENSPQFLFHWLQSSEFRNRALAYMGGSAGQQRVQPLFFYRFEIPEIACAEQVRVAEILDTLDAAIEKSEALIAKLKQVRAGILHDLLTCGVDEDGELRDPFMQHYQFTPTELGSFPKDWHIDSVGALFEMQLGKMLNQHARLTSSPLPYLTNRHVQWGHIDCNELEYMDFSMDEQNKFRLKAGDLLVCEGGEVGRTAIWRDELEECYFQKALHRLRPKNTRITPEYMLVYMQRAAQTGRFLHLTAQTSIAHLPQEKLALLKVVLPPRDEQERMSEIWTSLDDEIQECQGTHAKLNQIKKGLSADLLTGQVRVPPDLELP